MFFFLIPFIGRHRKLIGCYYGNNWNNTLSHIATSSARSRQKQNMCSRYGEEKQCRRGEGGDLMDAHRHARTHASSHTLLKKFQWYVNPALGGRGGCFTIYGCAATWDLRNQVAGLEFAFCCCCYCCSWPKFSISGCTSAGFSIYHRWFTDPPDAKVQNKSVLIPSKPLSRGRTPWSFVAIVVAPTGMNTVCVCA